MSYCNSHLCFLSRHHMHGSSWSYIVGHGSLLELVNGSWVTVSDPLPALPLAPSVSATASPTLQISSARQKDVQKIASCSAWVHLQIFPVNYGSNFSLPWGSRCTHCLWEKSVPRLISYDMHRLPASTDQRAQIKSTRTKFPTGSNETT